jgi:hypothetical protein
MRNRVNVAAGVTAALTLCTCLLGGASSAQAVPPSARATCENGDSVVILNGDGAATTNKSINLKSGDYSDCPNVGQVASGKRVYLYCSFINDYNNQWWYVRVAGTSTYGWTSADNLVYLPGEGDDNGDGRIDGVWCTNDPLPSP